MSVKKVEVISPKITLVPRPLQNSSVIVIESNPKIVVIEVSNIGTSLELAPSSMASSNGILSALSLFIWSIITITSFTTIPHNITIPRKAGKDNGNPNRASPGKIPMTASGIENRIIKVCLYELN